MNPRDIKISINPHTFFRTSKYQKEYSKHLRVGKVNERQLQQLKSLKTFMDKKPAQNPLFKRYHDDLLRSYGYDPRMFVIAPDGYILRIVTS